MTNRSIINVRDALTENTHIAPAFAEQLAEMLVQYYGPKTPVSAVELLDSLLELCQGYIDDPDMDSPDQQWDEFLITFEKIRQSRTKL